METIAVYLDNMFAGLPRTARLLRLKEDLLATMEEKYVELKNGGKTENEAIGIVISEFGNIDELIRELDLSPSDRGEEEELSPIVNEAEAEAFIDFKAKTGRLVGIGGMLCIIGVSMLVLVSVLAEDGLLGSAFRSNGGVLGLILMFLLIVPAIGLFIYSGMKSEQYEYLKKDFLLTPGLEAALRQRQTAFMSTYTSAIITGVCMCVLSVVALFASMLVANSEPAYGLVFMLLIAALGVFLFIYYGNRKESYSILLKTGDYSKKVKETNRVLGAVAAIVWPLATVVFLISGLVFNQWHINWIVFPVTGILFGMFAGVYNISKGNDSTK